MENLSKALSGKTLSDLSLPVNSGGSNLIEPTKLEIEKIMEELKKGLSYSLIKKQVRRSLNGTKLGFSYGQIKEIESAMKEKVVELTPQPNPEVV